MKKKEQPADEFLHWLYRERRLSVNDLRGRLRALDEPRRRKTQAAS